jgi:hypothetical protein
MLGLARASEWAGWWAEQGSNLDATITDITSTATDNDRTFLVRPSYYADWTGVTEDTGTNGRMTLASGSAAFDMTSIGTNDKRLAQSVTFRVGTDWMVSASGAFVNGWNWNMGYNNNGSFTSRGMNAYKTTSNYGFSSGDGGDVLIAHATFDANYRNTWLTYMSCMSPTPATDFASWTGGTDPFGNGWGTRARLINAETGTLISTVDTWNYNAAGTIDLTQTWELNTGTYQFGASVASADISLYDRDQMEFISFWHAIGSSFDPAVYSNEFFGTGIASTVAGVRSWIQWTAGSAGTLLNNGTEDYGYKIPAGGDIFGSRAPDGMELEIYADPAAVTAQTIPEFIQL